MKKLIFLFISTFILQSCSSELLIHPYDYSSSQVSYQILKNDKIPKKNAFLVGVYVKIDEAPVSFSEGITNKILSKLTLSNVFNSVYSTKQLPDIDDNPYRILVEIENYSNNHMLYNIGIRMVSALTLFIPKFQLENDFNSIITMKIYKRGKKIAEYKGEAEGSLKYQWLSILTNKGRRNILKLTTLPTETAINRIIESLIRDAGKYNQ